MPLAIHCINHQFCQGYADGDDHLCQYCREVARQQQKEKQVSRRHAQLTTKPRKPNLLRELEMEDK